MQRELPIMKELFYECIGCCGREVDSRTEIVFRLHNQKNFYDSFLWQSCRNTTRTSPLGLGSHFLFCSWIFGCKSFNALGSYSYHSEFLRGNWGKGWSRGVWGKTQDPLSWAWRASLHPQLFTWKALLTIPPHQASTKGNEPFKEIIGGPQTVNCL